MMWQRFTERARRVVFFSQEEAGRLGQEGVGTEHFLLGLVRENDNVAVLVLDRMGVSLGQIRVELERQVSRGENRPGQDMQLTPECKRVIDLSCDEARQLSNTFIGTEHLLLGLIRDEEGLAGRVLAKFNLDLDRVREEVVKIQNDAPEKAAPVKPRPAAEVAGAKPIESLLLRLDTEARKSFRVAETEALNLGERFVSTEHILLGLIADEKTVAFRTLTKLKISPE